MEKLRFTAIATAEEREGGGGEGGCAPILGSPPQSVSRLTTRHRRFWLIGP